MIWETFIKSVILFFFFFFLFFHSLLSHPYLKLFTCFDKVLNQHFKMTCKITQAREQSWGWPGCREALWTAESVLFRHMVQTQKWEKQQQDPRPAMVSASATFCSLQVVRHGGIVAAGSRNSVLPIQHSNQQPWPVCFPVCWNPSHLNFWKLLLKNFDEWHLHGGYFTFHICGHLHIQNKVFSW